MARRRVEGSQNVRRRLSGRKIRARILILCEGAVTEPEYFKKFISAFKDRLVRVEIDGQGDVPTKLVERAVKRKGQADLRAYRQQDDFLRYNEVWCVFDVDEHSHISEARELARSNEVHLAISNPCFELWALLHFADQTASLDRTAARSLLRRHLPGYRKALPFARLHPNYAGAVRRAEELERRRASWQKPAQKFERGFGALYQQHVTQANDGCDFDFLEGSQPTPDPEIH